MCSAYVVHKRPSRIRNKNTISKLKVNDSLCANDQTAEVKSARAGCVQTMIRTNQYALEVRVGCLSQGTIEVVEPQGQFVKLGRQLGPLVLSALLTDTRGDWLKQVAFTANQIVFFFHEVWVLFRSPT